MSHKLWRFCAEFFLLGLAYSKPAAIPRKVCIYQDGRIGEKYQGGAKDETPGLYERRRKLARTYGNDTRRL